MVRSGEGSKVSSWALLLAAMAYPTVAAWIYFWVLAGRQEMAAAYFAAKVGQALLPLLGWLALRMPRDPAWHRPGAGWGAGILAGTLLSIPPVVLYLGWLRDSPLLQDAPGQIHQRLEAFHATTLAGYLLLALGLSLVHSLFEEYYWRWFLFAALRRRLALPSALALSSLAFASHHAVVIFALLGPGAHWLTVATGTLAIALGGCVWAWLFHRFGSLLSPWVSHVMVDLAVMAIGLDLLGRA